MLRLKRQHPWQAAQGIRATPWRACLALLLALVAVTAAFAQPKIIELRASDSPTVIDSSVRAWVDMTGQASVDQVHALNESAFGPLSKRGDALKGAQQALWLRIDVNAIDRDFAWYLGARQVSIDQVSLYTQDSQGKWHGQHAGTAVAVATWPIPDMRPVFAISAPVGMPQRLYVRAHDPYGSWTGLQIMSTKTYLQSRQYERLILGLYIGVTLVVVGLALASWLTWREPLWLSYAGYNLCMTFGQLAVIGLLGATVLDRCPFLHEISVFALIEVAAILCVAFALHATQAFKRAPRWAWASVAYISLASLTILAFVALRADYTPGLMPSAAQATRLQLLDWIAFQAPLIGATGAVVLCGTMFQSWRSGYRLSGAMLLAMLPVVAGSIPQIVYSLNQIPRSAFTEYGFILGLVTESIAMLYVMQRHSRDLAATESRMRELDRVDALTGLVPRKAAIGRLDELITQSADRGQPCAVMLVQLDNIGEIEREHGASVRDNVLLVAAGQVGAQAASGDLAARVGQTRFLVAYGKLLHEEGLRHHAAGVIASGLRGHALIPVGADLNYRVWIAMHLAQSGNASVLIDNFERHADLPADSKSARRIHRI